MISKICLANYASIMSRNVRSDHVHMIVSIPLCLSTSKIVQHIDIPTG
ncbi:MAG: transposase [Alphaproteobacteria bacterium]|nr:transposase [Alphaproteobacteria bacterium]